VQGPFFATVKSDAPFQINSPVVNATELCRQDRRLQRIQKIRDRVLVCLFIALPIAAIVFARRARTRWPFVTVLLYGIFFILLVLPFLWGIFVWLGEGDAGIDDWTELPEMYGDLYGETAAWPLWVLFASLFLAQVCLLIIPVRTAHQRPKPRRGIWLTAIAAAFLYTVLLFGAVISILSAIFEDNWPDCTVLLLWIILPANWLLWIAVFRLFANRTGPIRYIHRIVKWLIGGSILELLIAVPSHIIVRHRNVCCAHLTTAAGIAAGLAVMFFAFGPGLYYLYRERINRKKPDSSKQSSEQKPEISSPE
jgi:hypothetical protein